VLSAGILFFAPEDPLLPWALGSFAFSGGFLVLVGAAMADTVRALRATQARERAATAELQTLVGELGHRGRNAIAVFSALVTQSLRSAGSLEEGERIIAARFDALARAQDEVVKAGGGATLVSSLVPRTLEPFDLARFEIDLRSEGAIAAEAATALALILHELATNAVKYGALSTNGHVQISCLDTATSAVIRWQELGGPPVLAPSATGFGERLLKVGLHSHGGRAERRFEETGVVCELELPHAAAAV
jgi:two-component sensor histidine kinase